jgi:predicted RNA-binding protein YlxR (DUF448 family)
VRFAAPAGTLVAGRGPGRGAYLCPSEDCAQRALRRGAFARRLRRPVTVPAALLPEAVITPTGRIHP